MEVREPRKINASKSLAGVRSNVLKSHGLALSHVLLLEPRTIPKTTSGKIARAWCKKKFLSGDLRVIKGGRGDYDTEQDGPAECSTGGDGQEEEKKVWDPTKVAEVRAMSDEDILSKVSWNEVDFATIESTELVSSLHGRFL